MECKTVQIKSTHPESQGPFVEINAGDFCEAVHELYIAPPPGPPPVAVILPPGPPPAPPPPPPPPPPVDALADLPKTWRAMKPGELRALAERVTGRTPENTNQAVQLIEAALAARAGK